MIYRDSEIYLEWEKSTIPWVKLFTVEPYREMSDLPPALRQRIFDTVILVEREMRDYFHPDKINLASFGNYLPRLHWHIMARYKNDSHFPEPMWGTNQRKGKLELPDFSEFENGFQAFFQSIIGIIEYFITGRNITFPIFCISLNMGYEHNMSVIFMHKVSNKHVNSFTVIRFKAEHVLSSISTDI